MEITARMERTGRAALVAAAAILTLSFGVATIAQQGGGRPAAASGARPTPPARAPSSMPSRRPETLPERAVKPEAAENAAAAATTVEHTEAGIVRTTTVTNQHGTRMGSTTVSRDDEAGTKSVTTTNTGFDGETRSIENTVTKTDDGALHEQTKEPNEESEAVTPPEN